MINRKTIHLTAAALALSAAMARGSVFFNFSVWPGANIQFNGTASSFQFNNNLSDGHQWWLTGETGGTGSAFGLQGYFTGGPWTYGAITTSGLDQSATVSPTAATLTINDGAGHLATANVIWVQVDTHQGVGGMNANLAFNLSGLSYTGSNPDLVSFFSAPAGALDLSFQFNPVENLSDLTSGAGPYTTSFSGSLMPVPEPTTLMMLGLGLALLARRTLFGRLGRN